MVVCFVISLNFFHLTPGLLICNFVWRHGRRRLKAVLSCHLVIGWQRLALYIFRRQLARTRRLHLGHTWSHWLALDKLWFVHQWRRASVLHLYSTSGTAHSSWRFFFCLIFGPLFGQIKCPIKSTFLQLIKQSRNRTSTLPQAVRLGV